MLVTQNKFLFLIFCTLLGVSVPGVPGLANASGTGSNGGNSEREEFLRKFATDPSVVKEDPTPAPIVEEAPSQSDQQKLETIIQNFRKNAVTVQPGKASAPESTNDGAASLDEEGQAQGTIDLNALKNLQGMMGSGDGKISLEELLKKMQASGMKLPGLPGSTAGGNADYSTVVYQLLHPFRAQSEAQVAQIFNSKMQIGFFGGLFKTLPFTQKIPQILARIVRDETALPSVAKIVGQRGKLINYAIFVMVTFGISFLLKRLKQKQDDSIFSGMTSGILRALIFTGIRISVFFALFSAEFKPLWLVIRRSF